MSHFYGTIPFLYKVKKKPKQILTCQRRGSKAGFGTPTSARFLRRHHCDRAGGARLPIGLHSNCMNKKQWTSFGSTILEGSQHRRSLSRLRKGRDLLCVVITWQTLDADMHNCSSWRRVILGWLWQLSGPSHCSAFISRRERTL